jgi:site-specific DNA-methyltransferase (adenine-specific)
MSQQPTPYYADDYVTLYHGDCREITAWLAADVLVTDPPYGIGWKKGENKARSSRAHTGILNDEDTSVRDTALTYWGPTRPALTFGSFYAPNPPAFRQVLVWQKPNDAGVVGSTIGYRRDVEPIFVIGDWPRCPARWSSVLRSVISNIGSPSSPAGMTGHPHAKPVDLMRQLIERCPDGVVADPFAGSGSTLRAAKDLRRRAIGVELDERYCEIAAERLGQEVLDFGGVA